MIQKIKIPHEQISSGSQKLSWKPLFLGLLFVLGCSTGDDVKLSSHGKGVVTIIDSGNAYESSGAVLNVDSGGLSNPARVPLQSVKYITRLDLSFLPPKTRDLVSNEVVVVGTLTDPKGAVIYEQQKLGLNHKWEFFLSGAEGEYLVQFQTIAPARFPFKVPPAYKTKLIKDTTAPSFNLRSFLDFKQDTGSRAVRVEAVSDDPYFLCDAATVRNETDPESSAGFQIQLIPEKLEGGSSGMATVSFVSIPPTYTKPKISVKCFDDLGNESVKVTNPSQVSQEIGMLAAANAPFAKSMTLSAGSFIESSASYAMVSKTVQNKRYLPVNLSLLGSSGLPLASSLVEVYAPNLKIYYGFGGDSIVVPSTLEQLKQPSVSSLSGFQSSMDLEIPETSITVGMPAKAYVVGTLTSRVCPDGDLSSANCVNEEKIIGAAQLISFLFDDTPPTIAWESPSQYVPAVANAVIEAKFKVTEISGAPFVSDFTLSGLDGASSSSPIMVESSSRTADTFTFTFKYPFAEERDFRLRVKFKDVAGNEFISPVSKNLVGTNLAPITVANNNASKVRSVLASKYLCRLPQTDPQNPDLNQYYQSRLYLQNEGQNAITQSGNPKLMGYAIKVVSSVPNFASTLTDFFGTNGSSVATSGSPRVPEFDVTPLSQTVNEEPIRRMFTTLNLTKTQGESSQLGLVTDVKVTGSGGYNLEGHLQNTSGFQVVTFASGTAPVPVSNFECD